MTDDKKKLPTWAIVLIVFAALAVAGMLYGGMRKPSSNFYSKY